VRTNKQLRLPLREELIFNDSFKAASALDYRQELHPLEGLDDGGVADRCARIDGQTGCSVKYVGALRDGDET
jgi:hypothetical protein